MTKENRRAVAQRRALMLGIALTLAAGAARADERHAPFNPYLPPDALPPLSGGSAPPDAAGSPQAGTSAPAERSNRRLRPRIEKPPVAQPEDRNGFFGNDNRRNVYGLEMRRRF